MRQTLVFEWGGAEMKVLQVASSGVPRVDHPGLSDIDVWDYFVECGTHLKCVAKTNSFR